MMLRSRDAEVVEAGVPCRRLQAAVDAHERLFESLGVVMHLRQGPSLRTRVAVRERVVLVSAHPNDLVAVDVDEDAADRGADPAEAPHGAQIARRS